MLPVGSIVGCKQSLVLLRTG